MDNQSSSSSSSFSIKDGLKTEPDSVFKNKSLLRSDRIVDEDRIVGRDNQLSEVIRLLKVGLYGDTPEDMLLYGPSGTGKSLIMGAVSQQLVAIGEENGTDIAVVELNCRNLKSEDRAAYSIIDQLARKVGVETKIAKKGVSTSEKYTRLFDLVSDHLDLAIIILDELDLLWGNRRSKNETPAFADLLYKLTRSDRIGGLDGEIAVSVLTNNAKKIEENLDSRTESTFGPQKILFSDYDANQIQQILQRRQDAFYENTLEDEVISKAAAFGAQGDGDARKAIDLLRFAGTFADRQGDDKVTASHLERAQEKVEQQYTLDIIGNVSLQKKAVLYSAALIDVYGERDDSKIPNPTIYQVYSDLCSRQGMNLRSEESVRRWMREYETMGIVQSQRTSRGKAKGIHTEYSLEKNAENIVKTISEAEGRFPGLDEIRNQIQNQVNQKLRTFYRY